MPQVVTNQTTINLLKRMPNQLKIINNAIQKENSLAVRQKPLTNLKNPKHHPPNLITSNVLPTLQVQIGLNHHSLRIQNIVNRRNDNYY